MYESYQSPRTSSNFSNTQTFSHRTNLPCRRSVSVSFGVKPLTGRRLLSPDCMYCGGGGGEGTWNLEFASRLSGPVFQRFAHARQKTLENSFAQESLQGDWARGGI